MKKNLLAIGLLAFSFSVQAQNVLLNVDTNASLYVSEGTLVYNGGGIQTRNNGVIDLHGNMMVEGTATDLFRTISGAGVGTPKLNGGNIVVRMNTPATPATSTYGQLYVNGISQANITGIVSKEYRVPRQGNGNYYQQVAMPFSGKVLSSLSTELAKTFGTSRYSRNEILSWNNATVVSNHFTDISSVTSNPTQYYMLGSNSNNLNTETPPATLATIAPTATGSVYTLNGLPYAAVGTVALQNAGNNIAFGTGGNNVNQYNEKYNTYVQDQFELSVVGSTPFTGTYGKNIYQFGNPYLTNLDLSRIGYVENTGVNDQNNITNIWGVRYDPGTVVTLSNGSTYSTGASVQTYTAGTGIPVGDAGLVIKPMQTFVLKLRDNTSQSLNFNTLRRFNNTVRLAATDYSVTAAKTSGTVKQLGVIALDAAGKEIARTYYVVSPQFTTGHQTTADTSVQATATGANIIGTFEEAPNGGMDPNYTSSYWLYINEANEVNFQGKDMKLVNYDYGVTNNAVSYKFEIRENAELVPNGTHQLSAGIGFYYKAPNGTLMPATHGTVVPISNAVYDLYYGQPSNVLATANAVKPSRTMVVYNPEITNYIVRFDPSWKKADIQVYDMSGKLIITKTGVSTSQDFVIKLDEALKNGYVVKIVADNGETVNAKILK